MFIIETGKIENTLTIRIEGEATIARAKEIHAVFVAASREAQVEIDMSRITQVDLSFLQLIHALTRSISSRGSKLRFSTMPPAAVLSYAKCIGCCIGHWGFHAQADNVETAAA
ncbi:MAG: STAS domain-containing protein [Spirochaetes bacterium]|nr:STAS domain-containing protein [Spirochaetota bacterium]